MTVSGCWNASLDDLSSEMLAQAAEKIVQAGALDIFIASGLMRKGRLGFQLTVLCAAADREKVDRGHF